jgi:hypothetical protein
MSIATTLSGSRARLVAAALFMLSSAASAEAQPAPAPPPPLWDTQIGAAYVGTSGNTDTSTFGADFVVNRRWPVWLITATAAAIRASDEGETTAERYLALLHELQGLVGVPVRSGDHGAGGAEQPLRAEVRLPVAVLERAGVRVRED